VKGGESVIDSQLIIGSAQGLSTRVKSKTEKTVASDDFHNMLLSMMPCEEGDVDEGLSGLASHSSFPSDTLSSIDVPNINLDIVSRIKGSADDTPDESIESEIPFELITPENQINILSDFQVDTEDKPQDSLSTKKPSLADLPEKVEAEESLFNTSLSPVLAFARYTDIIAAAGAFESVQTKGNDIINSPNTKQNIVNIEPLLIKDADEHQVQIQDVSYEDSILIEDDSFFNFNLEKSNINPKSYINSNIANDKKSETDSVNSLNLLELKDKKFDSTDMLGSIHIETRNIEFLNAAAKAEQINLPNSQDVNLIDQVSEGVKISADKIYSSNSDSSLFSLKLKPDGLGEVLVKINRKSNKLEVEIRAELLSTKDLIAKELDTLRVQLNSDISTKPYQFATVTVDNDAYSSNLAFSGSQSGQSGHNSNNNSNELNQTKYAVKDETEQQVGAIYKSRLIDYIA
jgi:flagellar hook-length control protein FliK